MAQTFKKKIGIIGGTFNPIHYGHMIIAENAYEQFGLEKVIFIPTGSSPHKRDEEILPADDRCHMIEAAIEGNPHFGISRMEVNSGEISYTYRTLQILTSENPDTEYYFILGGDSLKYFHTWAKPQIISDLAKIVVGARDEIEEAALALRVEDLKLRYHAQISVINCPAFDISSQLIRKRVSERKSIRYFLPEAVESYIKEHKLYEENI